MKQDREPDPFVLRPVGELDMLTVPAMSAELQAELQRRRSVVVDLGRITFIGSHGIQMLLDADRTARACRAELIIVGTTQRSVARPLSVTGVDRVLPLADRPAGDVDAG